MNRANSYNEAGRIYGSGDLKFDTADDFLGGTLVALKDIPIYKTPNGTVVKTAKKGETVGVIESWVMRKPEPAVGDVLLTTSDVKGYDYAGNPKTFKHPATGTVKSVSKSFIYFPNGDYIPKNSPFVIKGKSGEILWWLLQGGNYVEQREGNYDKEIVRKSVIANEDARKGEIAEKTEVRIKENTSFLYNLFENLGTIALIIGLILLIVIIKSFGG